MVTGDRWPEEHHRPGQGDGTVTIWAVTSTVSGSGDQGADPNKVVAITDTLHGASPGSEAFATVKSAADMEVLRGVSFTPGTTIRNPGRGDDGDGSPDRS